ncbi:MAG: 50S ribosomal protein L23 [bacterium]|nr:50S ribosomal protein L23 [bacterium]
MNILIKPIITEKSMQDAKNGRFTFEVGKDANKQSIMFAAAEMFKVHPVSVTTIIVKGQRTKFGKRRQEKEVTSWKKALIKLKKDEKIDLFDIHA